MTTKRWQVNRGYPRRADICDTNENQGNIPESNLFGSGHYQPPAHTHCRCTLALTAGPPSRPNPKFHIGDTVHIVGSPAFVIGMVSRIVGYIANQWNYDVQFTDPRVAPLLTVQESALELATNYQPPPPTPAPKPDPDPIPHFNIGDRVFAPLFGGVLYPGIIINRELVLRTNSKIWIYLVWSDSGFSAWIDENFLELAP